MKAGSRFYLALNLVWMVRIFVLDDYSWLALVMYFVTLAIFVLLGYTD